MAKVIDEKGKVGRPSTKPVEKKKAYYVNVVVKNPHLGTVSNVLVSRDSKNEAMFLLRRSSQGSDYLGYWDGKSYVKENMN